MMPEQDGGGRRAAVAWLRVAVLVAALVQAGRAAALDQPISAHIVSIRNTPARAQLVFLSRDAAVPFPVIHGSDDPATGAPGGITIEVFTATGARRLGSAPAGVGNPGWKASPDSYHYRNSAGAGVSTLRNVTLIQGRRLWVRADAGLALTAPLGPLAIRVTTGSLRSCTVFDGVAIRRDIIGRFVGRDAVAPALADCSDASLSAAVGVPCGESPWPTCGGSCQGDGICAGEVLGSACRCVFPTQPCGETAPVCNGECSAGEQCYPLDDFIPGSVNACACAAIGEPPCGATGQACDGGVCPAGLVCDLIPGTGIYESSCGCVDPQATCGPSYGKCPPDLECLFFPPGAGGSYQCLPTLCGGTFPSCGGGCSDGRACVPLDLGSGQFCVCATPSLRCDEGLACGGGFTCSAGEICTLAPQPSGPPSCSCAPS